MSQGELIQVMVSALGGCVAAIGWWIANSLSSLDGKVERVLVQLESHEQRLRWLEDKR